MNLRELLDTYSDLGLHEQDEESVRGAVEALVGRMDVSLIPDGVEVTDVLVDREDECVCVEVMYGEKPVTLYFYKTDQGPCLGVDWESKTGIDLEFDISDLEPKMVDNMIDVRELADWMPGEVFADILVNRAQNTGAESGEVTESRRKMIRKKMRRTEGKKVPKKRR